MHEDLGGDLCKSLRTSDELTEGRESIVWPVWGGSGRVDSKSAGVQRYVHKLFSCQVDSFSSHLVSTTVTHCWQGCQGPSLTRLNGCSTRQPEWSVELEVWSQLIPTASLRATSTGHSSTCPRVKIHLCLQNKAPQYLINSCTHTSNVSNSQYLRSANRRQLIVPQHCRSTFGCCTFSIAGPIEWNSLPDSLHDLAHSTDSFRSALKTNLFPALRDK